MQYHITPPPNSFYQHHQKFPWNPGSVSDRVSVKADPHGISETLPQLVISPSTTQVRHRQQEVSNHNESAAPPDHTQQPMRGTRTRPSAKTPHRDLDEDGGSSAVPQQSRLPLDRIKRPALLCQLCTRHSPEIGQTSIGIMTWTNNYINVKQWDLITDQFHNFNSGKPPLKLGCGAIIVSNIKQWVD